MVTKLVPNSGKLCPMNTVLTQPEPITEIPIFNSKESMFTIMKLPVDVMFQELSLWILNQVLWTLSELVHSDNSSDQITSFSDKPEPVTTGLKVIILKELN